MKFTEWPPDAERARMEAYKRYEEIFRGDHVTAFEMHSARVPEGYRKILYIAVNLAGLFSKLAADMLFGEAVQFTCVAEAEQQAVDDIVRDNALRVRLYEAALAGSFRGDIVLRARIGTTPRQRDMHVILEEVPAYNYVAELDPDNCRNVLSEAVVWKRRSADGKQCFLRVETHRPGTIEQAAYAFNEETGRVGSQVPLAQLYDDAASVPPEFEKTGVSESLLIHIPNIAYGSRYYGISDYEDLCGIFDAINNRVSKIDTILDKHSEPVLAAPAGQLADPNGVVRRERIDVIELGQGDSPPEYVTWDGHLQAAFDELDRLVNLACAVAEVPRAAVQMAVKDGVQMDSGKALRLQWLPLEHKCNRKKLYLDPGMKQALRVASELGEAHGIGTALSEDPEVVWQDGLPQFYDEAVLAEATAVQAGLSSKLSAIKRLYGKDDAQAQEELDQCASEAAASMKAMQAEMGLDSFENGARGASSGAAKDDSEADE